MPWTVGVSLDLDRAGTAADVGTVTASYTDATMYASLPFVASEKIDLRAVNRAGLVTRMKAALTAETAKRTRENTVGAALLTALNT